MKNEPYLTMVKKNLAIAQQVDKIAKDLREIPPFDCKEYAISCYEQMAELLGVIAVDLEDLLTNDVHPVPLSFRYLIKEAEARALNGRLVINLLLELGMDHYEDPVPDAIACPFQGLYMEIQSNIQVIVHHLSSVIQLKSADCMCPERKECCYGK